MARVGVEIGGGPAGMFLLDQLASVFESDESRKIRGKREALEQIARLYPIVSKMDPTAQQKWYEDVIYPAYGKTNPPGLSRLFGKKSEDVLPPPAPGKPAWEDVEGEKELGGSPSIGMPGLRIPELRVQHPREPSTGEMFFSPQTPPLIRPDELAEITQYATEAYPGDVERQKKFISRVKRNRILEMKVSPEDINKEDIEDAQTSFDAGMIETGGDVNASMGKVPPDLRSQFTQHRKELADKEAKEKRTADYMDAQTKYMQQLTQTAKQRPEPQDPMEKMEFQHNQFLMKIAEANLEKGYSRYLDTLKTHVKNANTRARAVNLQEGQEIMPIINDESELPEFMTRDQWEYKTKEGQKLHQAYKQLLAKDAAFFGEVLPEEPAPLPEPLPRTLQMPWGTSFTLPNQQEGEEKMAPGTSVPWIQPGQSKPTKPTEVVPPPSARPQSSGTIKYDALGNMVR